MPAPISVPPRNLRRAACLLTLASFASAQSPSPPASGSTAPTIQVYSRETIVDVIVTDAKGNPVRNLNQSSFTISEDGNPQPIRSFAEFGPPSRSSNPPKLPPNVYTNFQATPANGPINILLIDAMHSAPVDVVHSLRGAERYFLTMPPGTQVAVFWLAASGLHMLQGLTSDPALLLRAVRTNRIDFGTDGDDRYSTDKITIDALNQIAAYVSPIKGRKNLLWFTPGMPVMLSRDGGYAFPDTMVPGKLFGGDPNAPDMTRVHRLMDTYELFTDEQIAVSPINPIGVAGVGWTQLKSEQVAEDTGGEAFYNNNDLKPLIAQAIRDGSHFYTLSYIPPRQQLDGHYHHIKVETTIPNLHLVYRAGYNSEDPPPIPQNSGTTLLKAAIEGKAPAATQLLFDVQAAPSSQPHADAQPLDSQPPPQTPSPAKTTVTYDVLFLLPQSQVTFLANSEGIYNASLQFDLAAYDIHGKLVASKTQAAEWPLTNREYHDFVRAPFKLSQQIDLPPGQISLRVGVLDNTSNKVGTLEIPLTVAEIPKHPTPPPASTTTPCPPRCPLPH